MTDEITYIYVLRDPETDEIRYVGKAVDIERRMYVHLTDATDTHKARWIQTLKARGLKPRVDVVDTILGGEEGVWQEREKYWISYFREMGCDLTNTTEGGEGGLGVVRPDYVKKAISKKECRSRKWAREIIRRRRNFYSCRLCARNFF